MNASRKRRRASFQVRSDRSGPTLHLAASSWRQLLEAAGLGLSHLLHDADPAAAHDSSGAPSAATQSAGPPPTALPTSATTPDNKTMIPIELQRIDFDAVLGAWVHELLEQSTRLGIVFDAFEILQLDLEADCRMTATAEGSRMPSGWRPGIALGAPSPRARRIREGFECELHFESRGSATG